ncbi:hypothetical protein SARC_11438 [Sphaeroforma arctica JP610]|uniref:Uncharacterized protein n=1 Tax=Sphaeroforma arctica JP610 TaxID=667725 RepID=A0A0L0FH07_9EUKA|nr:hypothetical protein SARC_11438 [Sphaeroforma arctica JP610]KNC76052.1 hypothetical protein SARC_11438 [Sphaeroforma arctica JP610]|eukprot:XP_014149954.1 hypothetical protein SARC_11438 [Sphaeroforma arctica JP610]
MGYKADPVRDAHFVTRVEDEYLLSSDNYIAPSNVIEEYAKQLVEMNNTRVTAREYNAQIKRDQVQKAIAFDKEQTTLDGSSRDGFRSFSVQDDALANLLYSGILSANSLKSSHVKRAMIAVTGAGPG